MRLRESTYYLLLTGFGIAVVYGYTTAFGGLWYAYNPDSAAFIEAARNLLAGHGLVQTPSVGVTGRELAPLTLWPPGFPTLAALASALTGLPPKETVLWLSRGATALLPLAISFALRPLLGLAGGSAVGVLALLSPFVLEHGFLAMSDMPFLLLAVLSFGLLQRSMETRNLWLPLILSGLVAGLAYTVRNTAVAWFAAVIGAFVLSIPLRLLAPIDALRRAGLWLLGALLAISPMWVRNFMLAGELNTYSAHTLNGDPVSMARLFLAQILEDLTGSHQIALFAWDAKLFVLLVVPVAAILLFFLARRWQKESPRARFNLLTLALYLGAGSAMVVIAAIKWLGVIDPRLIAQYSWLLLALSAAAILPRPEVPWTPGRMGIAAIVLLALLGGRFAFHVDEHAREKSIAGILAANDDLNAVTAALPDPSWILRMQLARLGADNEQLLSEAKALPPEVFPVSNMGYIFRIEVGKPVRSIYLKDLDGPKALSTGMSDILKSHGNRPVWFSFLPSNQMLKTSQRDWQSPIVAALPESCRVNTRAPDYVTALCPPIGRNK